MKTLYTTIIILILSISANAQTNEWTSVTPGNWNLATNWSLGVVPTASHDVAIPSGSGTVTIPTGYIANAKIVFVPGHLIINQNASLTVDGSTNYGVFNTGLLTNNGTIIISNTPSSGIFNYGIDASFSNYGEIKCLFGIGNYGIYNLESASFTNGIGGTIEISNTFNDGINNNGTNTTFTNKGMIKCITGIGADGIENSHEASFTNDLEGSIEISNTVFDGISNYISTFTNKGSIKCLLNIGSAGISNSLMSNFVNDSGSNIEISNTDTYGIFNSGASVNFTNKGSIKLLSGIDENGIHNAGTADFTNEVSGTIELSNIIENGILNSQVDATFTNKGTIKFLQNIGKTAIINEFESSFTNVANGLIEISNVSLSGILNTRTGTVFTNKGNIKFIDGIIGDGIYNVGEANFLNDLGGSIELSNTSDDGIESYGNNTLFTNKGTIKCLTGIGDEGITNQYLSTFINEAGGLIELSNTTESGIQISDIGTTFQNSGMIKCLAGIGHNGIMGELGAAFTNNSTGHIEILHADQHGINISSSSSFTNKPAGYLKIVNTGGYGIHRSAGDFLNEACGIIEITEQIYDLGTIGNLTNSGYILQEFNGTNITSIINNGVIEDIHGSFPNTGITNWGYIVAPLSDIIYENQIVNDALLGIGNGYTVIDDKFFTDINLTTSAGPYNFFNNTWTPNSNAVGLSRFFIQFHNGTCAVVMEINLDNPVRCQEKTVTWNSSSSNIWDDPDNWTPAGVPDVCGNIEIGVGQDVLILSGTTAEALSLKNSGTLTIEGYLQLYDAHDKPALHNVNGQITNNGVILIQNVTGTNPMSRGVLNNTEGGSATITNNGTIEIDQISKEGFYNTGSAVFMQNGVCRITNAGTIPFNNAVNAVVKGSSSIELIGGGIFFNLANVNPGNSPGQLTIDGIYDCDVAAITTIEIAGTDGVGSPDGHDQLVVSMAELNGTLDVSLLNGYVPNFGESFIIMTSSTGNINSTFSTIIHTPPTYWEVDYYPEYMEITAVEFLPVELLSFNVRAIYDVVQINWTTTSEKDNDYFTVERSRNGKDWTELRTIEGSDNSNHLHRYQTIDEHPFAGLSYYRLKQTDVDGSFTYSPIKSITIGLSADDLRIYPNPTNAKITIEGKDIHTYQIFDSTGREMKDITPYINQGETQRTIDLSGFLPGMYFIKTETTIVRVQKL